MVADEGQTPVMAHGHWHRPGTFMGETVPEEQEPILVDLEALDGFSTVDEYREKMAALEGVQLTGDSYGYGRVPSIQDFLPGTR